MIYLILSKGTNAFSNKETDKIVAISNVFTNDVEANKPEYCVRFFPESDNIFQRGLKKRYEEYLKNANPS